MEQIEIVSIPEKAKRWWTRKGKWQRFFETLDWAKAGRIQGLPRKKARNLQAAILGCFRKKRNKDFIVRASIRRQTDGAYTIYFWKEKKEVQC